MIVLVYAGERRVHRLQAVVAFEEGVEHHGKSVTIDARDERTGAPYMFTRRASTLIGLRQAAVR